MTSLNARAALLSLLIFGLLLGIWHLATMSTGPAASATSAAAPAMTPEQIEYAKLMGKPVPADAGGNAGGSGASPVATKSGFPTLAQMGSTVVHHLADPFYDKGPNDKGIGLQLAYSLGRVALGYLLAALVAIPLGFAIGMSPLIHRALDPFIQVLKPISPLAWMPLALYTIKDSAASGIFVIFICSVWPMLINTAFGVAGVRKEWLNVARTLEVRPLRRAVEVILPAAAPTILTGMRISMGIAWLVIVAAEMLVGGTGIGYFVWNEWNNLSLPNVVFAILVIGLVGMALDGLFARAQKAVTYAD
ncbi:nitrate ABC transporter permease [Roseateles chitinivorans]|uniref:nitrate ABC transporter permease n=1 Tax=Roseateles chitinivorans TaxID=2917965 RepID=UPI003D67706C